MTQKPITRWNDLRFELAIITKKIESLKGQTCNSQTQQSLEWAIKDLNSAAYYLHIARSHEFDL